MQGWTFAGWDAGDHSSVLGLHQVVTEGSESVQWPVPTNQALLRDNQWQDK